MSDCNAVYAERNKLVAFLSKCYPSCKKLDPTIELGDRWWIIYVETHEGQLSWHVREEEAETVFAHLPVEEGHVWDGHTTAEKYERLARLSPNDEAPMVNDRGMTFIHRSIERTAVFYDGYGGLGMIGYRKQSGQVITGMVQDNGRINGITFLEQEEKKVLDAFAVAFAGCKRG